MRLSGWSLHPVRVPYVRAVRWSDTAEDAATLLILRLRTDEGYEGVAEGTVKPTWSGTSMRSLAAGIEDILLPRLEGLELDDRAEVGRRFARIPENQLAKAMVDNALWDLHAQAAGRPLWQCWNGIPEVEVSWTITRDSAAAMARDAATSVERYGFRTLKVKGGQGMDLDEQILRAIRGAVGDGVRLYVDANGAYRAAEADEYLQRLAAHGVSVAEDPYSPQPDALFESVQSRTRARILVDFNCASPTDAHLFLERGARALSVKPGRVGLSDCGEIVRAAGKRGCEVHVGLFGEADLGSLVALQLGSALNRDSAWLPAEPTFFLTMSARLLTADLAVRSGRITLPAQPGIAPLVDWERVRALALS